MTNSCDGDRSFACPWNEAEGLMISLQFTPKISVCSFLVTLICIPAFHRLVQPGKIPMHRWLCVGKCVIHTNSTEFCFRFYYRLAMPSCELFLGRIILPVSIGILVSRTTLPAIYIATFLSGLTSIFFFRYFVFLWWQRLDICYVEDWMHYIPFQ